MSSKHKDMEAKEPVVTYYTGAMMNAMKASIVKNVQQEKDVERLELLYHMYNPTDLTFAEEYAQAKAFCEEVFPKEMWPELAKHDYFVHHRSDKEPETEEEWATLEKELEEEEGFDIPHDRVLAYYKSRFGW